MQMSASLAIIVNTSTFHEKRDHDQLLHGTLSNTVATERLVYTSQLLIATADQTVCNPATHVQCQWFCG